MGAIWWVFRVDFIGYQADIGDIEVKDKGTYKYKYYG
jgi:hypothetical protein